MENIKEYCKNQILEALDVELQEFDSEDASEESKSDWDELFVFIPEGESIEI